jgi:hypothetical protein
MDVSHNLVREPVLASSSASEWLDCTMQNEADGFPVVGAERLATLQVTIKGLLPAAGASTYWEKLRVGHRVASDLPRPGA